MMDEGGVGGRGEIGQTKKEEKKKKGRCRGPWMKKLLEMRRGKKDQKTRSSEVGMGKS